LFQPTQPLLKQPNTNQPNLTSKSPTQPNLPYPKTTHENPTSTDQTQHNTTQLTETMLT